jgi:hypothetical protein
MMSRQDENIFIGRILDMKEKGFSASKAETLPSLFRGVYGRLYSVGCGSCERDAFDTLIRWALKRTELSQKNKYMAFKIKHEYREQDFAIMHKGARLIINSGNLNDERAKILLSIPKYAHVIEGNSDTESENIVVKKAAKKDEAPVADPNGKAEAAASEASSASTSTEAPAAGKASPKNNKAKPKGK